VSGSKSGIYIAMFKRRTLFIVGAGASTEVDLPTGPKLAESIGKMMDIRFEMMNRPIGTGDMDLYNQLTQMMRSNVHEYQQAAWLIRDGIGLARSIDDFLDLHRSDNFVNVYGKAAIVKSVLLAERASKLYLKREDSPNLDIDLTKIGNTWYVRLIQMLSSGISREQVGTIFDSVSFIVFNYDRCIEYFLQKALQRLYSMSEADAAAILAKLTIIHPYGKVGELYTPAIRDGVPFGGGGRLLELSRQIRTYTEQIEDEKELRAIHAELSKAEKIIFLGFAYHDQNLKLLKPKEPLSPKKIYGTAYKLSQSDVEVVDKQLIGFFQKDVAGVYLASGTNPDLRNNLTCAGLFDDYARSLPA
jgi:hypothetical protein